MTEVMTQLLIILLLLIANGVFALSELSIISARKARLQQRAERGDAGALAALELARDPGPFLSTVQIGITLVGIFTGAFGGAMLSERLAASLEGIPFLAPYRATLSLVLVVLGITYLSLIIGELVPKRLALNNPEGHAVRMARPMQTLSRITSPIVRLLSASTDLVLRLFGVRPSSEPPVTEEEINVLIRQGTAAGIFEEAEGEIVERVFQVADQRVGSIMVPRRAVVALDVEDLPELNRRKLAESGYSTLPVFRGSLDHLIGIIRTKEIMRLGMGGDALDLEALAHPPLVVPETLKVLKLLERFKQTGQHTALVIDEYGGTQGMVTLGDVLEAIVGDMPEAGDKYEQPFIEREDGTWLVDGSVTVAEFADRFRVPMLERVSEDARFETLGGFVMSHLGRIPAPGDCFDWGEHRFEVMDMDGMRIDKVLVQPPPASTKGEMQ